MKDKVLVIAAILLISNLVASCGNQQNVETREEIHNYNISFFHYDLSLIDLQSMELEEKVEKGIGLRSSPDGSTYFFYDHNQFLQIFLEPEELIFDYLEFFEVDYPISRPEQVLTTSWGGLSDRIYLTLKIWVYSEDEWYYTIRLWSYDLEEKEWEEVDLSFLSDRWVELVTTVDDRSEIVFKISSNPIKYYLIDVDKQTKELLPLDSDERIVDQSDGVLLLERVRINENGSKQSEYSLFDLETMEKDVLSISIPLSSGKFIPQSDYIGGLSYWGSVVFDPVSGQSMILPGDVRVWDIDGTCIYGSSRMLCLESVMND